MSVQPSPPPPSRTVDPQNPSGATWRELLGNLFAKAFQNKIRNPDTLTPYLPLWRRETKSGTTAEAQAWAQLLIGLLGEALLIHIHPRNVIVIPETSVTPSPERDSLTLFLEPADVSGLGLESVELLPTRRKSLLEGTGTGGGVIITEGDAVKYRVRSNRSGRFVKVDNLFPIGLMPQSEEEPFVSQVQEIFQSGRVEVNLLFQIIILQGLVSSSEQPELIAWLADILRQRKMERITQVVQKSSYTPAQKEDIAALLSMEPINTPLLQGRFPAVYSAIFTPKNAEAWKLFGLVTSTEGIRRLTALTYLRLLRDYQLQRVFLTQATARLQATPRTRISTTPHNTYTYTSTYSPASNSSKTLQEGKGGRGGRDPRGICEEIGAREQSCRRTTGRDPQRTQHQEGPTEGTGSCPQSPPSGE